MGLVYLFVLWLPELIEYPADPANLSTLEQRSLDCEVGGVELARRAAPGTIDPPAARGDYFERRALVCRERLFPPGRRSPRDEAILGRLSEIAALGAGRLRAQESTRAGRRWLVEVAYPNPQVAEKISAALKVALFSRGFSTSERRPELSGEEIASLAHRRPAEILREVCQLYQRRGELKAEEGLLFATLRHLRETQLHFATCRGGSLHWL